MSNEMNTTAKEWISVCQVEEIPKFGGRSVRVGQAEVALFRLSDGRIKAVANRCPHKQGPLSEGIVSGDTVICPLHARKINLETGEVLKPDSGCVKTHPTKIEGDQVFLSLG
jgi:nitrite reductase (NADH) small subunit